MGVMSYEEVVDKINKVYKCSRYQVDIASKYCLMLIDKAFPKVEEINDKGDFEKWFKCFCLIRSLEGKYK